MTDLALSALSAFLTWLASIPLAGAKWCEAHRKPGNPDQSQGP